MGDLTNPRLIYLKGFLFLMIAGASCGLILYEFGTPRLILLLAVAIWSSARFYYFTFYVIEHYVDPGYKFAGLGAFVMYLFRRPKPPGPEWDRYQATTDHTDVSDKN
jgi:hypothetical protein